jgi:1,4-dihydroxy-2-naphthoyl-CoA synthase
MKDADVQRDKKAAGRWGLVKAAAFVIIEASPQKQALRKKAAAEAAASAFSAALVEASLTFSLLAAASDAVAGRRWSGRRHLRGSAKQYYAEEEEAKMEVLALREQAN